MNPDQKLIQIAYEDAVRQLYFKLFDAYASSGGDATQQQQAGQRFLTGIGFARSSRDNAIALLAGTAAAGS